MITEEIKEFLKSLTPLELLEIEQFVNERRAQLQIAGSEMNRKARVLTAKREIFTEYDSLLSDLAK